MKGFEEIIKKFPRCAEGYALYAQVSVKKQFLRAAFVS
jgi:import receptor subunit TOM70